MWPKGEILFHRGKDFVAARMGRWLVVSCYISPQATREQYLSLLDELGDLINDYGGSSVIVAGVFNVRSPAWNYGITNNYRGSFLEKWVAERDLRLANIGVEPTSVNPRGTAVVDLTWVTSDLSGCVIDWRVDKASESLSDHDYIQFGIVENVHMTSGSAGNVPHSVDKDPRWNYGLLDADILTESMEWSCVDEARADRDSLVSGE